MKLPFTWPQFEREIGREVPADIRKRLTRCTDDPSLWWEDARSIVVAPQLSIMGQTLWQCVEAITLTRYPQGSVPSSSAVIQGLCYAAGLPYSP
jgi:protein-disulfide isomerase-like protein with CxxC motif